MFEAEIRRMLRPPVIVGPTDTRDEASRLARAWIEAHPHTSGAPVGEVIGVQIRRSESAEVDE